MSYRLERRYDAAPLDAALPADANRGRRQTSVTRAGARGVTCLSAVPFFTEAGDVYVFAYKIKKSTLAFHGTLGPHIVTSFVSPHRSVLIDLETVTARRAQQPRVSRGLKARGRGSTRKQGGHRQEDGYGRRKCPPHGFPSVFIAQWADEDMRYALAPRAHSTRAQRRWS